MRFTEKLTLSMKFHEHVKFKSEFKNFCKKHKTAIKGFESLQRLLVVQFDPLSPSLVIHPGKIHRMQEFSGGVSVLWKVEIVIPGSGLRPNQWPRLCFSVTGDTIIFLAFATHQDNYDNAIFENYAIDRFGDFD